MDYREITWDSDLTPRPCPASLRMSDTGPSLAGDPCEVLLTVAAENQALRELVESLRSDVKQYRTMLSLALTRVRQLREVLRDAGATDRRL